LEMLEKLEEFSKFNSRWPFCLVGFFNYFVAASKEKTELAAVQGFFWLR